MQPLVLVWIYIKLFNTIFLIVFLIKVKMICYQFLTKLRLIFAKQITNCISISKVWPHELYLRRFGHIMIKLGITIFDKHIFLVSNLSIKKIFLLFNFKARKHQKKEWVLTPRQACPLKCVIRPVYARACG